MPDYVEVIKVAQSLITEPGLNPEYERGIVEVIIYAFDIPGMNDDIDGKRGFVSWLLGVKDA